MDLLIKQTLEFIKQEFSPHDTFVVSPDDIYPNQLKSGEFNKKAPHNSCPKQEIIAGRLGRQDSCEDKNFETSPPPSPPNPSTCLGISVKKIVPLPPEDPMTEENKQVFTLTPIEPPKHSDMSNLKELMSKVAPHVKLLPEIPDDTQAKKISSLWKEHLNTAQVILLSYGQTGQELKFLQNVAQAIDSLLAPCKLIDASRFEKENKWQIFFSSFSLRLIIAPERQTWAKTQLSSFYKENPVSSLYFLEHTPLQLLSPISHYFKNPSLKKHLWKSIASHLLS